MGKGKKLKGGKITIPGTGVIKLWHEMTPEERIEVLKGKHKEFNKKFPKVESGGYRKQAECHKGNIEVFTDPDSGVVVYGGGTSRGVTWYTDELLFDLATGFESPVKMEGIDCQELLKAVHSTPKISIKWRDYGIPNLDREDWLGLVKGIRAGVKGGKIPSKILVACVGGHGRTGTCLSILAGLMGACSTDPVEFVRGKYCTNAVESNAQLDYVEEITQIEVKIGVPKDRGWGEVVVGRKWEDGSFKQTYPVHIYGCDYDVPYGNQVANGEYPLVEKQ